jgi:hypothetical protein
MNNENFNSYKNSLSELSVSYTSETCNRLSTRTHSPKGQSSFNNNNSNSNINNNNNNTFAVMLTSV